MKRLLLNARLTDIIQIKKDRILKFQFSANDPFIGEIKRELILEIMGRNSNLILTENNIIIDAYIKRFSEIGRSVLPKLEYTPFPTDKKLFNYHDLNTYSSPRDLFNQCMGLSMDLAMFIYNHQIDIDIEPTNPTLYDKTFHAFDLRLDNPTRFQDLSSLLKSVYQVQKPTHPLYKHIQKEHKKQLERIDILNKERHNNQDFDQYRLIAEAIYASGLDLKSHYTEFQGNPLDYSKSLNENAQRMFKIYKKKKASIDHLETQITLSKNAAFYLSDLLENFDNLDLDDLTKELMPKRIKRPSKKQSHYTYTGDNYTIFVGKSSSQNEYLTHQLANKDDLWFHVKDGSGAHVILQGEVSEQSIRKAATFAALGSPLKHSSSVAVIYTKVRFVKKIKGRPGFYVTYTNEKTIYIDP